MIKSESFLLDVGYKKCSNPYSHTPDGRSLFRMLKENRLYSYVDVWQQTEASFPDYEFKERAIVI
jgi:hypothetical protein